MKELICPKCGTIKNKNNVPVESGVPVCTKEDCIDVRHILGKERVRFIGMIPFKTPKSS